MDMDLEKFMIQVSILNTLKCFGFIFFCSKGKQMYLQSEETLLNQINCFIYIF